MEKRLFQTLDEINVADGENNTSNVGICNFLVSANKTKQGGHVTMGVPESVVLDLVLNPEKKMCLLLVIEKSEYDKIQLIPSKEKYSVEDMAAFGEWLNQNAYPSYDSIGNPVGWNLHKGMDGNIYSTSELLTLFINSLKQ